MDTSAPFTWGAERRTVSGGQKNKETRQAGRQPAHLDDSVSFLDAGLDRRAARADILDQLDPLPADGEAEAQMVLLHDHASVDETGTWGEDKQRHLARQQR